MPGPGSVRLPINPRGGQRRLYSLRGTVEKHSVRESGWWIFKERFTILNIHLNPAQVEAFNRIAREGMSADGCYCNLEGIASDLSIGVTEAMLAEFPVGAQVGITVGYAGPISQFFEGRDPLAVTNVQVIKDDTALENEVEVPSPEPQPSVCPCCGQHL